jgi:D-alanyl-D-alanine carboxypeptidase
MNRRMLAAVAGAVAALLPARAAPAQTLDLRRVEAVADSLARAQIAAGFMPGMTVAVARGGKTVFVRGYGRADVEMDVAAGPETVYGIASLTKQFTAAMIMRLADAGRISLDDPVTRHLPDFPARGRHVTVRHLLSHTSGIRGPAVRNEADMQRFRVDLSYEEMMGLVPEQPFAFEPGERQEYSNMGYYLLGEIIGRVTGTPYEVYAERELLRPLGLDRTLYCDARRVIPNRAEGHDYEDGTLVHGRIVSMRAHAAGGAGAFCSTVGDLVRWTHLLHGGEVVSPASLRRMTAPTVLAGGDTVRYGFGLYLDTLGAHRKLYHGGANLNGFGAYLAHYPEDGLTIAILSNSGRGREKAAEMEKRLARAAFGMEVRDLPLAARDLARYEGAYTLQAGSATLELRVFAEDGRLKAQPAGQPATRLRHQGGHLFVHGEDDDVRFVFTVGNGRAEGVTLQQGGQSFPGRRSP